VSGTQHGENRAQALEPAATLCLYFTPHVGLSLLRDRDVRALPGDRQFSLVKHHVVSTAQEQQILELVRTTEGTRDDVMHVEVA
jgi:hypothetical protein